MEKILTYFTDFTEEQLRQFGLLDGLYKEWNEKINVISRKDIDSLYEKHVLHALSIAAVFDLADGIEIMDLGTGGGFPGIPLAIYFPQVKFHLVDSVGKKLKVVEAIADGIGLKNITTWQGRADEINKNRKGALKRFDFVVSRAVAPLKDLWRWTKPLLKNTKSFKTDLNYPPGLICLKGGDLSEEIRESGTKPEITDIFELFPEEFFKDKHLLFVHN